MNCILPLTLDKSDSSLMIEMKIFANKCCSHSIHDYGYSFTPLGILRAGLNSTGNPYTDWRDRMARHRPSIIEYPCLSNSPLFKKVRCRTRKNISKESRGGIYAITA